MKVTALDPGGTTGYATLSADWSIPLNRWENVVHASGHLTGAQHHTALYQFLIDERPTNNDDSHVVIFEGFDNRANPAAILVSLEYIGIIKYWVASHTIGFTSDPIMVEQRPPDMKFADDRKLKAVGWYKPNLIHGNDASRHLLVWCVKSFRFPPVMAALKAEFNK